MRKLVKVLLTAAVVGICLFYGNEGAVKAEEITEVPVATIAVEGIEFSSDEEALTYLTENYDLQLPYGLEISFYRGITLIGGDTIQVEFFTESNLGVASSIGVKNVYLQYGTPGSDMLGNHMLTGTFTATNTTEYTGTYSYSKLEKGYQYRGKQTHFIIVNGVEYSYTTYTKFVNYYC